MGGACHKTSISCQPFLEPIFEFSVFPTHSTSPIVMIVFAIGFPNDGLGWYQSYFPSLRHSDVTWGPGIARGGVRPLAPPTDCHPRIGLFAWAYLKACEGWGILLTSPLGYPDPVFPTFSIIWGALGQ